MCSYSLDDCIEKAKEKYINWLENDEPLNDYINVVLQTAMRYATEKEWNILYKKALATSDDALRLRQLRALASTRQFNLLKLYFFNF